MRVRGMVYRELEEVLPDQEETADVPPDPPPLQEKVVDTPEDRSGPVPPPVEPADTPVVPDEMKSPQFYEEEVARGNHPYQWTHRTGDTTRSGGVASGSSPFPLYSWSVVNVLGRHHLICETFCATWSTCIAYYNLSGAVVIDSTLSSNV